MNTLPHYFHAPPPLSEGVRRFLELAQRGAEGADDDLRALEGLVARISESPEEARALRMHSAIKLREVILSELARGEMCPEERAEATSALRQLEAGRLPNDKGLAVDVETGKLILPPTLTLPPITEGEPERRGAIIEIGSGEGANR